METTEVRVAAGRAARQDYPRTAIAVLAPRADGVDATTSVLAQASGRLPELIPLRHHRMSESAFAFYRGTAGVMAADLADGSHSGLVVQLCGDAHLSNFGLFGSPERRLLFDLNDFDETLPGPFEWDVKRLVASVELAGRSIGATRDERRRACLGTGREYRMTMQHFARARAIDVWYARLDAKGAEQAAAAALGHSAARNVRDVAAKARRRDHLQAVDRLTEVRADGRRRFRSDPPLVVPIDEQVFGVDAERFEAGLAGLVDLWRDSLPPDRRRLATEYEVVDLARKVVGVGSVGTRAWIILLQGANPGDLVVLQAKEAQASVLEPYLGASEYEHHGRRVVEGQRLMQAASDVLLGWQTTQGIDGILRDFYVRQLRDWKGSVEVEQLRPAGLGAYARLCAWTLARAHARSGDRLAIAAYLGTSSRADEAFAQFATDYADRVEVDHAHFVDAIARGEVPASSR
ncbi:DUF2252 domain-containing protein [Cellulomonas composti]|uniref:DUF2252 domain-containing protein n=1 Tax=Cellulomonas composti TaxID=266130 RepID=UPI001FE388F2|nr:DUF2252 domain-containing protein [Cellulomonas composti]